MCDTVAAVIVETMLPATCRVVVEDSARPARRRREQRPDPAMVNVSIPKPTPLLEKETNSQHKVYYIIYSSNGYVFSLDECYFSVFTCIV